MSSRNSKKELIFKDYPEFIPNLTPREIFELGSFGGTYWRPITSRVNGVRKLQEVHTKQYDFLYDIPDKLMITPYDKYNKKINKYQVKCGSTLKDWEDKGWINKKHPYGWVHWYCDFYKGKRSKEEDKRQIGRWSRTAGPKSRFRRRLMNMILDKKTKYNDFTISPKIRQTLQHWGYQLTSKDLKEYKVIRDIK
mgnify:CR=1 FL=1